MCVCDKNNLIKLIKKVQVSDAVQIDLSISSGKEKAGMLRCNECHTYYGFKLGESGLKKNLILNKLEKEKYTRLLDRSSEFYTMVFREGLIYLTYELGV